MLLELLRWALLLASAALMLPTAVLLAQVLLALLPARPERRDPAGTPAPRLHTAVLVPAHNEAAGIAAALQSMRKQLAPGTGVLRATARKHHDDGRLAGRGLSGGGTHIALAFECGLQPGHVAGDQRAAVIKSLPAHLRGVGSIG